MPEEYLDAGRDDADHIKDTLGQLDELLKSPNLAAGYADEVVALRRKVSEILAELRTDLAALAEAERDDVLRVDPTLATRRFQLIRRIETAKIAYEFDVLPALEKLTKEILQQTKQSVPGSTEVPTPSGERWTVQKVVAAAEQFISTASTAVGTVAKGYALVKALGLLVGVPLP